MFTQQTSGSIHSQKVGGVEPADELYIHFAVVDIQQHPFESVFQYFPLEIGQGTQRVGCCFRFGVLYHNHTVLIILVGQRKSCFGQIVKECFLCLEIILKSLVVIQMIAGDVGEDTAGKFQSADTFLCHRMRTDLHKSIFAAFVRHSSQ